MIISAKEYYDQLPGAGDLQGWEVVYDGKNDRVLLWDPVASIFREVPASNRVRDANRIAKKLTRVRYAGRDYRSYFEEAQAWLRVNFPDDYEEWETDPGASALGFNAELAENLAFYQDVRATEGFMFTANLPLSVALWSAYLGYKMKGASGASTDLQVIIDRTPNSYGFPIIIPRGHQFFGPDGLIYEAIAPVIYTGDTTQRTVSVREGVSLEEVFASDGSTNQVFSLRLLEEGQYVANASVHVDVDGNPWTAYDFLPKGNIEAFAVGYISNPATVRFGDGVIGKVPRAGAALVVEYVRCSGDAGRLVRESIDSAEALVINFQEIGLTVYQPNGAVGGEPPETIESAKANAPRHFAAGKRAVSSPDWIGAVDNYASPYGAIVKSQVIIPRKLGDDPAAYLALRTLKADGEALEVQSTLLGTVTEAAKAKATETTNKTAELTAPVDTQQVYTGFITQRLAEITSYLSALATYKDAIIDRTTRVQGNLSEMDSLLVTIVGLVNSASADDADGLEVIKVQVATMANQIRSMVTLPTGDASLTATRRILDQINLVAQGVDSARGNIDNACYDPNQGIQKSNTEIEVARQTVDGIEDDLTTLASEQQTILAQYDLIKEAIDALQVDIMAWVDTDKDEDGVYIGDLAEHLNDLFSKNCASNVAQVYALARDRDGFYAAPSQALLDDVEEHLNSLKMIELTARVLDGTPALVYANVTLNMFIDDDVVEEDVEAEALTRVEDLLRDREFGVDLHGTDVTRLVVPPDDDIPAITPIEGVRWARVLLWTTNRRNMVRGSIVVGEGGIITRGTLSINAQVIRRSADG